MSQVSSSPQQQQTAKFNEVSDAGELEALFARSQAAPVVLFKHSLTCPISAYAYREMSRVSAGAVPEIALVVVQHARATANAIAERTGVRHETPQAIILHRGASVWSASHYNITTDAIEQAVSDNS